MHSIATKPGTAEQTRRHGMGGRRHVGGADEVERLAQQRAEREAVLYGGVLRRAAVSLPGDPL